MTNAEREEIKRLGLERYNRICEECGKKLMFIQVQELDLVI